MIHVGTAGWSIPKTVFATPSVADAAAAFVGDGSHLARYGRSLDVAEIDSSFHRPHRVATYARWAATTPAAFRFAVKLPRTITHDAKLVASEALLDAFLAEVAGLGDKLAVLLVQLAPSLAFDACVVADFFVALRARHGGAVACEPRHASWFAPAADALLVDLRVARVAADPARVPAAAIPGGWLGPDGDGCGATIYHRWHGSPQLYRSSYEDAWLAMQAAGLARWPSAADVWCVFDNTAAGAALVDALRLRALVTPARRRRGP